VEHRFWRLGCVVSEESEIKTAPKERDQLLQKFDHSATCTVCFWRYDHQSMFELTRREQMLVAGFVFILVLGLGVQHWRQTRPQEVVTPKVQKTN
jgi:hypothetical protein